MSKFTLAVLLAVAAGEAAAAAARVDFAYGNVTVSGLDGREQPLVRGAELDNGDTVRTADGRAQLRFGDGAYVSLQPNSEFVIRDYRFDGKTDGAERGFFGLAKGAMRTVTGLIGRVNRDRYQVTTPTATIGIRGTGGVIQVLDDGSTLIVGTSGIWSLTNPSGSVDVPEGVSALSPATPDVPPQRTSQAPQAGPAPLPLPSPTFRQGEQVAKNGQPEWFASGSRAAVPMEPPPPQPAPVPLTTGSGYAAAFAYGFVDLSPVAIVDSSTAVAAVFNSSGQLTEANAGGSIYRFGGTNLDFNTDGILAWGRWTGQVTTRVSTQPYSENQGLHYVIGMPTPVMPTQGIATYTVLGATRPTYVEDGLVAPGTFTGSLNVNFATLSVGVNLNMAMQDGRNYAVGGNALIASSTFAGFTGATAPSERLVASGSGGACTVGCSAAVKGFFSGTSAERAGLGYQVTDTDKQLVGAAAFRKQ